MIESISIIGGHGKRGAPEPVRRIDLRMGEIVSIVGPTGSGKTTLINDIELFADGNTPSNRGVLINGVKPGKEYRDNPSRNPIALITQHTTFLSDLPVEQFLLTHARIRQGKSATAAQELVGITLDFANELTGEPVVRTTRMTELSGGQTRALLIADASVICDTPIVLLDEVENAGIYRSRALELLKKFRKIFIFVTHDPHTALLSDYRVVMKNGEIVKVLRTDEEEKELSHRVGRIDSVLGSLRERMRHGERLRADTLQEAA